MHLKFFNHDFILDGRRAAFWSQKAWLLIADVHWGKTHFFQRHGLSVGHGVLQADLERLATLIYEYNPQMIVCLGDLIHHEHSLTKGLLADIGRFRDRYPVPMTLIKGNHEKYIHALHESWGIEIIDEHYQCEGLNLCHEEENGAGPQLFGHLHPKVTLKGHGDHLSLPFFLKQQSNLILPAFSDFCAGKAITLNKGDQAFVCFNEKEVISIP